MAMRGGEAADMEGANLTVSDLEDANLQGANLRSANAEQAQLGSAHLKGAELTNVASGEVTGEPASLPGHWALVGGYLAGPGANLSYARFG